MSAFTMEQILADARGLVARLREHENTADSLLAQTQELSKKVDTMKTYQDNMSVLNEIAERTPQPDLALGLFQENSEIGELHRENLALRQSLDEHQLTLDLIMSRYRDQVTRLVAANRLDRVQTSDTSDHFEEVQTKVDQICNMADVMFSSLAADDGRTSTETEHLTQLRVENAALREMLTAGRHSLVSPVCSRKTQTTERSAAEGEDGSDMSMSSSLETSFISAHTGTVKAAQKDSPRNSSGPCTANSLPSEESTAVLTGRSSPSNVSIDSERTLSPTLPGSPQISPRLSPVRSLSPTDDSTAVPVVDAQSSRSFDTSPTAANIPEKQEI